MNSFIGFIMGPMVWISFIIFIGGVIYKITSMINEVKKKEAYIFNYMSLKFSFRSIGAWLVPFLPRSTRQHPVFWGVTYFFHILVFLVPIFLSAHVVLFNQAFGISWPTLSDGAADAMTVLIICALGFFFFRRRMVPEIKYLTAPKDFFLLAIVALPFVTGFLAYHQFFAYRWVTVAHVLTGELMLMLIPFSNLVHMILGPFTRAYTGSEFGGVRNARDW
ncbi:MAG: nitrate reductase [Desulfobacterales bacterium]|nr:nitrate reductase [Desulfobacterales bacterium]